MKFRESGMPQEEVWQQFFKPQHIINQMDINDQIRTLVDIGSGYGTFLVPISKIVSKVIGIDIEKDTVDICTANLRKHDIINAEVIHGDISKYETIKSLDKYLNEIDYITLFNILHCEEPLKLLKTAYTLLSNNGKIGVIHWKYEKTPRGPSMDIRPRPEAIIDWATTIGFKLEKHIELHPYHFGLIFVKE